jgi:hypothetical protein
VWKGDGDVLVVRGLRVGIGLGCDGDLVGHIDFL